MKQDNFESRLFSMTTIVESKITIRGKCYVSQGSGFYFVQETPTDSKKSTQQWYRLDGCWLVTNRHVVLPKIEGAECIPDNFTFNFREIVNGHIEWKPITLKQDQLLKLLKLHKRSEVDVALINIKSFINLIVDENNKSDGNSKIIFPSTLSNFNLPENQPITIDVTSDVIVASYPKGFYDKFNKFPIVKSGIVASAYNFPFNGLPMFLIDAQLFPGSSGGLVISKPTNLAMINGVLHSNSVKQFALLGVYSGEYIWHDSLKIEEKEYDVEKSYGLGNVWYSYLITEIIENGVFISS